MSRSMEDTEITERRELAISLVVCSFDASSSFFVNFVIKCTVG